MYGKNSKLLTAVAVLLTAMIISSGFAVMQTDGSAADADVDDTSGFDPSDIIKLLDSLKEVEIESAVPMIVLGLGSLLPADKEFPELDPADPPENTLIISGAFEVNEETAKTYNKVYVLDGAEITLCGDSTIETGELIIEKSVSIDMKEENATSSITCKSLTVGGLSLDTLLGFGTTVVRGDNAKISAVYEKEVNFFGPSVNASLDLTVDATMLSLSSGKGDKFLTLANDADGKAFSASLTDFDLTPIVDSATGEVRMATLENLIDWISKGMDTPKMNFTVSSASFTYNVHENPEAKEFVDNTLEILGFDASLVLGGTDPLVFSCGFDALRYTGIDCTKDEEGVTVSEDQLNLNMDATQVDASLQEGILTVNAKTSGFTLNKESSEDGNSKSTLVIIAGTEEEGEEDQILSLNLVVDVPAFLSCAPSIIEAIAVEDKAAVDPKAIVLSLLEAVNGAKGSVFGATLEIGNISIKSTNDYEMTTLVEMTGGLTKLILGAQSEIEIGFATLDLYNTDPTTDDEAVPVLSIGNLDAKASLKASGLKAIITAVSADDFSVEELPDLIFNSDFSATAEISFKMESFSLEFMEGNYEIYDLEIIANATTDLKANFGLSFSSISAELGSGNQYSTSGFDLEVTGSVSDIEAILAVLGGIESDSADISMDASAHVAASAITGSFSSVEDSIMETTAVSIHELDLSAEYSSVKKSTTANLTLGHVSVNISESEGEDVISMNDVTLNNLSFSMSVSDEALSVIMASLRDSVPTDLSEPVKPEFVLPDGITASVTMSVSATAIEASSFEYTYKAGEVASTKARMIQIGFSDEEETKNLMKFDFGGSVEYKDGIMNVSLVGKGVFDGSESADPPVFQIITSEMAYGSYGVAQVIDFTNTSFAMKLDSSAQIESVSDVFSILRGLDGALTTDMKVTDLAAWTDGSKKLEDTDMKVTTVTVTGVSIGIMGIDSGGSVTTADRIEVMSGYVPSGKWALVDEIGYDEADIVVEHSIDLTGITTDGATILASHAVMDDETVKPGEERQTLAYYGNISAAIAGDTIEYNGLALSADEISELDMEFLIVAGSLIVDPVTEGDSTYIDVTTDGVPDAIPNDDTIDKLVDAANGNKTQINVTTGNDSRFSLTLTKDDIDKLAGNGSLFSVKGEAGLISLDAAALKKIGDSTGTEVKLALSKLSVNDVAQYVSVSDMERIGSAPVFSITNSADVHQLGGKLTFTLPYEKASEDLDVVLYYLNTETGKLEAVQTVYDAENKTVTGTVDHMSFFTILEESVSNGPVEENIALFVIFVATMVVIGAILVSVAALRGKMD